MNGLMDMINRHFAAEKKRFEDKAELQRVCKHESGTYTECTDYHRRDFGSFCKECDKLLSDNG